MGEYQAECLVSVPTEHLNVIQDATQECSSGDEQTTAQEKGKQVITARFIRFSGHTVLDECVQVTGD